MLGERAHLVSIERRVDFVKEDKGGRGIVGLPDPLATPLGCGALGHLGSLSGLVLNTALKVRALLKRHRERHRYERLLSAREYLEPRPLAVRGLDGDRDPFGEEDRRSIRVPVGRVRRRGERLHAGARGSTEHTRTCGEGVAPW